MAHLVHPSLNSNNTLGESPVPLLIDIMKPVTVKNEVKELVTEDKHYYKLVGLKSINEPALTSHPLANSPAVLCICEGIMFLSYREPHLIEHTGQSMGGSLC